MSSTFTETITSQDFQLATGQFPGVQASGQMTVSGGLTITNGRGGMDSVSGFSTEIQHREDGTVIPKTVTAPLYRGQLLSEQSSQNGMDLRREQPVGCVKIVVGGGAKERDDEIFGYGLPNGGCQDFWNPGHQPSQPDPDPLFQIFVRKMDGKTLTFNVRASDTVDSLKAQIYERVGIPACQQVLQFEGRNLREGDRLSEYHVHSECTMYLTGRLRGGGGGGGGWAMTL